MDTKRVTQNDIARVVGLSRAAVTLALKSHPSIPASTRERVAKAAKELGYAPDPMLVALAAYRTRLRPSAYQGTLAWLVSNNARYDWRGVQTFRDYFKGAQRQANKHGYGLEVFDVSKRSMGPRKLADILRARNVPGLLLCPQPAANVEFEFPFQDFSVVTFGYTLIKPQLHTVTATQYRAMVLAMRKVRELGYKRIGLAVTTSHDERADHNYLAGYLLEEHLNHRRGDRIPPLRGDVTKQEMGAWIAKYKLDAVVIGEARFLNLIKDLGYRVPEDIGVACPVLFSDAGEISGVFENTQRTGEAAADFLVSLILRAERGIPDVPLRMHIEGSWIDGKTLRPASTASLTVGS